jgi:hypothetical protein
VQVGATDRPATSRRELSRSLSTNGEYAMTLTFSAGPLVALIAGILILIVPRLLNYIIALYLIIIGVLGLLGSHSAKLF